MTRTSQDDLAARTRRRRQRTARRLILFNATTGYGLGHMMFTLMVLAVDPRLHQLMAQAPVQGMFPTTYAASEILLEPHYLWAGFAVSVLGAGLGALVGWFQARVLDEAGSLVRDAALEQTLARRTVDLTEHNLRVTELNRSLESKNRELAEAQARLLEAQDRLLKAERLAAVTETAVSVNHEINGPLMVILGQSELLRGRAGRTESREIARRLELIEEQAQRIAAITGRLAQLVEPVSTPYLETEGIRMLDLARSTPPALEPAPAG